MHAFEKYYAEELASGKRPQDILDPFGSPEDLAKELVRKRKPGSEDSLKEKRLSQSLHLYCVGSPKNAMHDANFSLIESKEFKENKEMP